MHYVAIIDVTSEPLIVAIGETVSEAKEAAASRYRLRPSTRYYDAPGEYASVTELEDWYGIRVYGPLDDVGSTDQMVEA